SQAIKNLIVDRVRINNPTDNFADYAYYSYGRTIAEMFLLNYSEKLWGVPAQQLSTVIAGKRLKGLTLSSLIKEFLDKKTSQLKHLEGSSFYYPKHGFGSISAKLADNIGWNNISLNSRLTKVIHQNSLISSVEINNSTIVPVSQLISTIPISILVNSFEPKLPDEILEVANSLRFRNVCLVTVMLDRPTVSAAATLYIPEREHPITRISEPKNRSKFMSPAEKTSLILEFPYNPEVQHADSSYVNCAINFLITSGLVQKSEILDATCRNIPYAYPILDISAEAKLRQLNDYLDRFKNLTIFGRNGTFAYSWMHNMMRFGKDLSL
ncbi:MAG: FAD-dependent oxidoreductase, partial [Candidatus Paceibacterota bacterium]